MSHSELAFKESARKATKYSCVLVTYSHQADKDSDLDKDLHWCLTTMKTLESYLPHNPQSVYHLENYFQLCLPLLKF